MKDTVAIEALLDRLVVGDKLAPGTRLPPLADLATEQPPRVAATLHLALVRSADRGSMVSRTYSGEEPLAGSTPDAMVAAFTRLSARLVGEAVRDLQANQARLRPTPP